MKEKIKVALAGNPNCGKTSMFNNITGLKQHVGNWPGKTVEKKEGKIKYSGKEIELIDLPGTYSLSAKSIEEKIAKDYFLKEAPDIIVQIIDATNLERNLYLTLQLIEIGANLILAINMNKDAERRGIKIDEKKISSRLGSPTIRIEAINKTGKEKLLQTIVDITDSEKHSENKVRYKAKLEEQLLELGKRIKHIDEKAPRRWNAIKLLENDKEVMNKLRNKDEINIVKKTREHLQLIFKEDFDSIIADERYDFISGLIKESVKEPEEKIRTRTERIDKIVTHRIFGIPLFLFVMYLMFQITFTAAKPITGLIETTVMFIGNGATTLINALGGSGWISSLVTDGIIGGVGAVLVFLPNILLLFMMISILEDSGYMARVAFIMDKVMHKIGLHGKSFIPLILGFGCNVPAIMATRTLESRKDRLLTMLINPFMSCGARLPVYILFVSAFFNAYQGLVVFSIYLLGIIIAIGMGLLFKKTLFKNLTSPFVMELPSYRLPRLKYTIIHMWERGKKFITKAGTIILSVVLLSWFLANLPWGVEYASAESVIGVIGKTIAPIFKPLGFGTWQIAVALIFGILAKEVVVGILGTLYVVSDVGLISVIASNFTPLSAYSFMVFVLLYIPCIATLATIKRESNSWGWMLFTAGYLLVVAWVTSFIIYRVGLLAGFV